MDGLFREKGKLVIYDYMRVNGGTNYDSYIKVMVHIYKGCNFKNITIYILQIKLVKTYNVYKIYNFIVFKSVD